MLADILADGAAEVCMFFIEQLIKEGKTQEAHDLIKEQCLNAIEEYCNATTRQPTGHARHV